MQVVFTIQSIRFEEKSNIVAKIYGRTLKGKKILLYDHMRDYFLVDKKKAYKKTVDAFKEHDTEEFKAEVYDYETELLKVYTNTTKETKKLADPKVCFEDDVPLEKKYLMEKGLEYGKIYEAEYDKIEHDLNLDIVGDLKEIKEVPDDPVIINPKVLFFDIETYDDGPWDRL